MQGIGQELGQQFIFTAFNYSGQGKGDCLFSVDVIASVRKSTAKIYFHGAEIVTSPVNITFLPSKIDLQQSYAVGLEDENKLLPCSHPLDCKYIQQVSAVPDTDTRYVPVSCTSDMKVFVIKHVGCFLKPSLLDWNCSALIQEISCECKSFSVWERWWQDFVEIKLLTIDIHTNSESSYCQEMQEKAINLLHIVWLY